MLYILLFSHFVGDFVCQSRYIAENKSKSWLVLTFHVFILTICIYLMSLTLGWLFGYESSGILLLSLINGVLHFCTDAATSRITTYFYKKGDMHKFFTTIGADQFLHSITLIFLWGIFEKSTC